MHLIFPLLKLHFKCLLSSNIVGIYFFFPFPQLKFLIQYIYMCYHVFYLHFFNTWWVCIIGIWWPKRKLSVCHVCKAVDPHLTLTLNNWDWPDGELWPFQFKKTPTTTKQQIAWFLRYRNQLKSWGQHLHLQQNYQSIETTVIHEQVHRSYNLQFKIT